MGKRKRSSGSGKDPNATPADAEDAATKDDAAKEDMAHVSPDMLAGSPDVFARQPTIPVAEQGTAPTQDDSPAGIPDEAPPVDEASTEPALAVTAPPPPPPPPTYPPPAAPMHAQPATKRGTSSIALGVVLVVVGVFFLLVRIFNVDLSSYGWPLFIIIPGLTLIVVGFVSLNTGALIPGAIVTMIGLILAYQNSTNDWPSWAYAWPLVAPGGVGLGLYLQGLRDRNSHLTRQGRTLMFVAALIFMIGFVLFETILNISGIDYGWFGKAALPALLIVIGIILLVRSMQRGRQI